MHGEFVCVFVYVINGAKLKSFYTLPHTWHKVPAPGIGLALGWAVAAAV